MPELLLAAPCINLKLHLGKVQYGTKANVDRFCPSLVHMHARLMLETPQGPLLLADGDCKACLSKNRVSLAMTMLVEVLWKACLQAV